MLFVTHLAFSIFIGFLTVDYLNIENKMLFFSLLMFFTSIPDIDTRKSLLGKKLGAISSFINFIFGHRKFFHSFVFIIPTYILFSLFSDIAGLSFLLASCSHLIMDALTPEGIFPLYPLKYRIKGLIKTGSFSEKMLLIIISALIIIYTYRFILS